MKKTSPCCHAAFTRPRARAAMLRTVLLPPLALALGLAAAALVLRGPERDVVALPTVRPAPDPEPP